MQATYNLLLLYILILILSKDKEVHKKKTQSCDNSIPLPKKKELETQILNFPEYRALLEWKLEDTYNVVKNKVDCAPRNLAIAGVLKHPELRNLFEITNIQGNETGVTGADIKKTGLRWVHVTKGDKNIRRPPWKDQTLAEYVLEFLINAGVVENRCVTCRLEHNNASGDGHIITVCRVKNDKGLDELKVIDSQVRDFSSNWANYAGNAFMNDDGSYATSITGNRAKDYFTVPYPESTQVWKQDKFSIIENNSTRYNLYSNITGQTCPWCKRSFKDLKTHQKVCKKKPTPPNANEFPQKTSIEEVE